MIRKKNNPNIILVKIVIEGELNKEIELEHSTETQVFDVLKKCLKKYHVPDCTWRGLLEERRVFNPRIVTRIDIDPLIYGICSPLPERCYLS